MKNPVSINFKVLSGFSIAIIVVGYFLLTVYQNAQLNEVKNLIKDQSLLVIDKSSDVLDDMQDIETGYRGFLVTADEEYLEPADFGIANIKDDLKELKLTGKNNEVISSLVSDIETLCNKKIIFAGEIISLCRQKRNDEAADMLRGGTGKEMMDDIRLRITKIQREAHNDINQAELQTLTNTNETKANFLFLAVFIFIVLVIFYIIIIQDIRREKKIKNNLFDASEQIRDLYDHAPSGYITISNDFLITQINATALKWLGYTNEELSGKVHLSEIVSEKSSKILNKITDNYALSNLEIELTGKNKIVFSVLLDSIAHKNKNGEIIERRIVLTDISERKQAEEQIHYLAGLIDQTNDAIFSMDRKNIIRSWNHGAEKLYGFTKDEVLNKDALILRSALAPDERKLVLEKLHENGFWSGEITHTKKDGTPIHLYISVTAVHNGINQVTGYVSVAQDMSTRKLYEEKLKNYNKDLIEKVDDKTRQVVNLLERVTDGFISIDNNWVVSHVNSVACKFLGKKKSEILGLDLRSLFSKKENSFTHAISRAFKTQLTVEIEDFHEYLQRWYSSIMYPDREGLSIFFRDVTKRRESEISRKESEEKYRMIFENNPLPSWVIELSSSKIIDVNIAAVKTYGYSIEEFKTLTTRDIKVPEERTKEEENLISNNLEKKIWTHRKKDGSKLKVEIFVYDMRVADCDCRLALIHDITEKLEAEAEVLYSRDQLRLLSTHLEKIREEERASIAREIHDELGQQLTGLKMDVSWVARKLIDAPEGTRERMNGMLALIDETVKSVRRIASDLRPGILDDLGLTAALDWQTHEFKRRTGIECNFYSDLKDQLLDKNIAIGVFRIYQEALTNVARHANATEVNANLSKTSNGLKLFISDNGDGIKVETEKKRTLGLLGMRERALMMSGNLSIDSQPGQGTQINLLVPIGKAVLS